MGGAKGRSRSAAPQRRAVRWQDIDEMRAEIRMRQWLFAQYTPPLYSVVHNCSTPFRVDGHAYRPDFVVVRDGALGCAIVEVDEFEHNAYDAQKDAERTRAVATNVQQSYNVRGVVFIRVASSRRNFDLGSLAMVERWIDYAHEFTSDMRTVTVGYHDGNTPAPPRITITPASQPASRSASRSPSSSDESQSSTRADSGSPTALPPMPDANITYRRGYQCPTAAAAAEKDDEVFEEIPTVSPPPRKPLPWWKRLFSCCSGGND